MSLLIWLLFEMRSTFGGDILYTASFNVTARLNYKTVILIGPQSHNLHD